MNMKKKICFLLYLIIFSLFISPHLFAQKIIGVDSIEILGVSALSPDSIRESVGFVLGKKVNKDISTKIIGGLRKIYHEHGYYDVKILTKIKKIENNKGNIENVFSLEVIEGRPSGVGKIELITDREKNKKYTLEWDKVSPEIIKKLPAQSGVQYTIDLIEKSKSMIVQYLAKRSFVGANVVKIEIKRNKSKLKKYFNSLDLMIYIEMGDRVKFGFRGNDKISRSDLNDIIIEHKAVGFSYGYAEEIRSYILKRYQSLGFHNVKIKIYTFEDNVLNEKHITYEIVEGNRVRINSIRFDGNKAFSQQDLEEKFFENSVQIVQKRYFYSDGMSSSADALMDWIKSKGYLSSKFITISREFNNTREVVDLVFYLYEGERTTLEEINIEGSSVFKFKEIHRLLSVNEGEPLNLFKFNEGIERLKLAYRNKGFLDFNIENENNDNIIQYFKKNKIAKIHLKVNEGVQFRVNEISIVGIKNTKKEIVLRELLYSKDDVLSENIIFDSEARVRRLGVFSAVSTQLKNVVGKPGFKDVRVVVSEASPGLIAGGFGLRNDLGLRVFSTFSYSNLWKKNHTFTFSGNANRRLENFEYLEYQLKLGYVWPWFLLRELFFRPNLILIKRKFISFDATNTSLRLGFERPLLNKIKLSAGLSYNIELVRQENAPFEEDNGNFLIGSIVPTLRIDLRDNPLSPTRGLFASASFEYASTVFGSQNDPFAISYWKFQWRSDFFVPLTRRLIWYLSFRTGFEKNLVDPIGSDGSIDTRIGVPLFKQFSLGGVGSLRGYRLQEYNVWQRAIQGTLAFVNYRTQIDLPVTDHLKIGPFADAGNLVEDAYSLGNLKYGVGVGIHYQTPVGPVNFDWGFKLNPDPGTDTNRFHFSVGIL